jgi:hypothetical protein
MSDDLIARHAADRGPSEWIVALDQFRDAYGTTPDFENATDRYLLLQLLRDAVRLEVERDLVATLDRRAARIREIGR